MTDGRATGPRHIAGAGSRPACKRRPPRLPLVLVGIAVAWNLLTLRAETLPVSYLDDSSVHEQMVRFATELIRAGRLPLTSWFPYLGLGSPQFLHYQSLPAMLTGLVGLATGPDAAFRWSLYLLLSIWPVSVYLGARLFDMDRWPAAVSAAMAPFLVSKIGIGYELGAYVWTGFGVWTQLWASLTLPLAWGFSWRAVRTGRGYAAAVALMSLTLALHFETGYLALIPVLLWPIAAGRPIASSVRRALLLVCGTLLASAWVIVPLLDQRSWAATNELLKRTHLANGYGARQVLVWLASGQLLDHGRIPIVTAFAAVGVALALARSRRDANARALLIALAVCLLLSFGRSTFGGLVAVIPGSGDIFFRRFMMGIQLVALLLAGIGTTWCAGAIWRAFDRAAVRRGLGSPASALADGLLVSAIGLIAVVLTLTPAWRQLRSRTRHNAAAIASQRGADAIAGAQLDRLISIVKGDGGGRVYAGMPSNWGSEFTVGAVPVFKYLERRDVDEVGYTLRTASLMTGPEAFFDERNPSDYRLFGIRYLILPVGSAPPIAARLVRGSGPYALWRVAARAGYVQVGRLAGTVTADRTNLGSRSADLLRSALTQRGDFLAVAFGSSARRRRRLPAATAAGSSVGTVLSQRAKLSGGQVTATVRMHTPGIAVLSASFDPGWMASIDDRPSRTRMVAPALVAVSLTAGTHRLVFRYRGYGGYAPLLVLCALTLGAIAAAEARRSSRSRSGDPG